MKIQPNAAVLAVSVWVAAIVLAWPAHHPYAALAVLAVHAVLLAVFG